MFINFEQFVEIISEFLYLDFYFLHQHSLADAYFITTVQFWHKYLTNISWKHKLKNIRMLIQKVLNPIMNFVCSVDIDLLLRLFWKGEHYRQWAFDNKWFQVHKHRT